MKAPLQVVAPCLALLPLVTTSCAGGTVWRLDRGLTAESIELQIDGRGRNGEIEYIIAPENVPEAIHAAMEALHPGGEVIGAELEYLGDEPYWELAKRIDGYEVEAMFDADGVLFESEAQVPASAVPQQVRQRAANAGFGAVRGWEQVRDDEGELVEFHVKTTRDGDAFKLAIDPDGELTAVWREVTAEVEVPVALDED